MTTAAEIKRKRQLRDKILKTIGTRRLTTAQVAEEMGLDKEDVRYGMMRLKELGFLTHDGKSSAPKWWAVEGKPVPQEIEFRPEADPHLKALMQQAWRGTPWQGMEAVL